ncbi:MAG TPA: SDR family oxidoreductase [Thermoanaerobaculales bacterium]|nr:SDR family oxidoreductase [Thermoanaerobaculales bacterium]HPA81916.1 SDR family oxidoreductase [Thermoanaerobaculales bacterium]HQL31396.1 SDR family oxidoreductase [Thermoanaerobaculales bacterium]HQN96568.1 SDR family oxidoreductase [Thermoanaerobaculales bacterium]HQP43833.1 SDR family oxidoreductase [Thermoanaerobaculales bacterium]
MAELKQGCFVVTGGGRGIGLETARELVAAGAEVCLVGRRAQPLAAAAANLGGRAWAAPCDVSVPADAERLAADVRGRWGRLDGLVNSAGVAPMAALDDTDPDTWDRTFAVNARGPYLLCRALGPLLRDGRSPAVVNVSSTLAEKPIPGMAAYNASKAALNQLTRSLALEWAPAIRVNAVMPGVVDTPIHADRGLTAEQVRSMDRIHPMRRIGRPGDVASLIVFLLSDQSSWITGAVVPIDGGMLAT